MSERPIAGRIWAGRLRVTAQVAAEQDFDFVSGIVQEAIYFDFYGEHPDHGEIDLTIGVCDDPGKEGRLAVLLFPAVVIIYDPQLVVAEALSSVAGMVRDAIAGWYETPERFEVGFLEIEGSRKGEP